MFTESRKTEEEIAQSKKLRETGVIFQPSELTLRWHRQKLRKLATRMLLAFSLILATSVGATAYNIEKVYRDYPNASYVSQKTGLGMKFQTKILKAIFNKK